MKLRKNFYFALWYGIIATEEVCPMFEQIYSQDEIFAAVLPLLKKYHAEKASLVGP